MQSIKLKQVIILAAIIISYSSISEAKENAIIFDSRYTTEQVGATPSQKELLNNTLRIHIPDHIKTVGEAIEHVLNPFGYRLFVDKTEVEEQYLLLILPLPKPHRELGPITLNEALSVLGGDSFTVVINPVTRRVFFQLKESHRNHVTVLDVENAKTIWLESKKKKKPLVETKPVEHSKQPVLSSYGPVASGEYLSGIVESLKIKGITHDQALVHLFKANSDAFSNGNMNYLLRDAMLTIPSFNDPSIVSATEASRIVDDQYRIWMKQKVKP